MTNPFVSSLDSEISRLEQAVERIPEVRQLNELRRVRALYGPASGPAGTPAKPTGSTGPTPARVTQEQYDAQTRRLVAAEEDRTSRGRRMAPERQQAIELIRKELENQKTPIKTADLLEMVRAHGINFTTNDPVNNLSALLSTSGHFQAHGRSGWTLKNTHPGVTIVIQDPEPLAEDNDPHPDGENEPFKMRRL